MKIIQAKYETNGEGEPCITFAEPLPTGAKAIRFDGDKYVVYEQGDEVPVAVE